MGVKYKPDDKATCGKAPVPMKPVGLVEQYIGSSYDIVKQVYEQLAMLKLVADNLNLNQGVQGDVATVVDNGDGTYTITGGNGSVTWNDGLASTNIHEIQQYSIDGATTWHSIFVAGDEYKRVATVTSGVTGAWGTAYKIVAVDGVDGVNTTRYLEYEYSVDGTGSWVTVLTAAHYFRRERVVTLVGVTPTYGTWSTGILVRIDGVTPVKGTDYDDGLHGNFVAFIFNTATNLPATPTTGSFDGVILAPPAGWELSITSPITTAHSVYVSKATFVWDGAAWSAPVWSAPAKISGDVGMAGRFNTFIFQNATVAPTLPVGGTYDGAVETVPAGWLANPSNPAAGDSTWMTMATWSFATGAWVKSAWVGMSKLTALDGYTPIKDTDYFDGAAGTDGNDGAYVSLMFRNNLTALTAPVDGVYDGTTETPPTNWATAPTTPAAGETTQITRRLYQHDGTTWTGSTWSLPTEFGGGGGSVAQDNHMDVNIINVGAIANALKVFQTEGLIHTETLNRVRAEAADDSVIMWTTDRIITNGNGNEGIVLTFTLANSLFERTLTVSPLDTRASVLPDVRANVSLTLKRTAFTTNDALADFSDIWSGGTLLEKSRPLSVKVPANAAAGGVVYFVYFSQAAGNSMYHESHQVLISTKRVINTIT